MLASHDLNTVSRALRLFSEAVAEIVDVDVLHQAVPFTLLLGFFVVALAADADPNLLGEVADAIRPDILVELGVDSHVGSSHHLSDKLSDFGYGAGCLLLELDAMRQSVQVHGRVDAVLRERLLLLSVLTH